MTFSDYGIILSGGGKQQRVTCPECTPHRKKKNLKDLAVNVETGVWFCHHCGWKGSLNDKQRIQKAMIQIPKKIYKKPEKPSSFQINEKSALWMIEKRKISNMTLTECSVSHENSFMPQTGKKESCIVFNYFINSELINKKYRTGGKHFKMEKDARLVFYAPLSKEDFKYGEEIFITEGEMDCLTMVELGYKNTISPPNGAPPENVDIENVDFSYFDSLQEIAPKFKRAVLIMDNDFVGARFRDELARRIGFERCSYAEYPEGCKDINDVLVKFGPDKAREVVKNCKQYPVAGKYDVSELYGEVYHLYKKGFEPGKSTGWVNVDRHYTVRKREFTIVTGIPSHGKSSWLDALMVNLAKNSNWSFAIFSPENFPFERHIAKFCELYVGKAFDSGYKGFMSEEELAEAVQWCNKHFHFILPSDDSDQTLDNILALARASIFNDGVQGVVIDPWNEIEHEIGKQSETVYISKALTKLRRFCRVNDVHSWLVAHPTKLQKNRDGKYPKPTLYDISGSAHFYNKTDNGIVIYRDFEEGTTEINIPKIRFKEIGKPGKCKLKFNPFNGRYSETQ